MISPITQAEVALADPSTNKQVLLTGSTGFVGKVVLEELLRRREELGIEEIHLVIRRSLSTEARTRFEKLANSPAFRQLSPGWQSYCSVVEADLGDANALPRRSNLAAQITHIIHCAASVEFDLPVSQAAAANITSALNMVAFAKRCPRLVRMVSVSTAYVTPHPGDSVPVEEVLAPLPRAARAYYEEMKAGPKERGELDKKLMAETGHPNSYTLSKCVAEHLVMEERGDLPLIIVRPSIVSACSALPFPGWIDSRAAFAGFVALIGMGHLRAVNVNPSSALDIIPCDEVAHRLLECAFITSETVGEPGGVIKHATAGRKNSNTIDDCCRLILSHFRRYPQKRAANIFFMGGDGWKFRTHDFVHHKAPIVLARATSTFTGKKRLGRQAARLGDTIQALHVAFPYFTHNTFDFQSSMPLPAEFDRTAYVAAACAGIGRHLLGGDPRRASLAGRKHHQNDDLRFAVGQPHGNVTVRTLGFMIRKALRRCVEEVTFDHPSFEAALAEIPKDTLVVLVPTHRSYMDFLLVPLLCFARPELGVRPPRIAAAEEFSKIPLLGRVFERAGAFYIRRGQGRADQTLNNQIAELVANRETLMFFIEGKRSRDRRFLSPKTGLLRSLASTNQRFAILPIAISYDRVPEEQALLAEIASGQKPQMRLLPLLKWMGRMARGEISLGRVHLACGRPVHMQPGDDVPAVSREVMSELQHRTVTTTHHLQMFLRGLQQRGLATSNTGGTQPLDLAWLRSAIEARGGEVIDSKLATESRVDLATERTLRQMFQHLFYPDALIRFADRPDIVAGIEREHFRDAPVALDAYSAADPRLDQLLDVLFSDDQTPIRPSVHRPSSLFSVSSMFSRLRGLVTGDNRPRA